jgi:4-amino-4-deoxy-L-arabinose transferase-like glycosyltransferase
MNGALGCVGRWLASVARHWPILLIVPLSVALGLYYSETVPIFEVPDEPLHFDAVRRLAESGDLAALEPVTGAGPASAPQPPLYHVIGARLIRGIALDVAEPAYVLNPYSARGQPDSQGNKNAVLHSAAEEPPYRGVALVVHVLRWFSVLCGAATVALAYALALAIMPTRRSIAAGAAALVAFNPQFIFVSASACPDALLAALTTAGLLLCARVANGQSQRWRTPLALGVVMGLAALTRLSGLFMWVLIPCAYALAMLRYGRTRAARRDLWCALGIAVATALAVAGWWFVRNAVLYADPLAWQSLRALQTERAQPLEWREVAREALGAFASFWGVFGWMNVLADEFFYTLVRLISVIGGVGALLAVVRTYWQAGSLRQHRWPAFALVIAWFLVILVSLVLWTRVLRGPQGRQLFPAIAPIALLLSVGVTAWAPRHLAPATVGVLAAVLLAASALLPARSILPAYARPRRVTLDEAPASMHALDSAYGDELFLLGYEVLDDQVVAGQDLHLRLYWLGLKRMSVDHTFYVHVFGRDGQRIGGVDTYPGGGNYPTTQWVPGDVVSEEYSIRIAADAEAPVAARLRVGVYTGASANYLPAKDASGQPLERNVEITRVRVVGRQPVESEPQVALGANFDNHLQLDGYTLAPVGAAQGDTWNITLYWTALEWMPYDYTVFVHLVDAEGVIVEQSDAQPLNGDLPTLFWRVGDRVVDPHSLMLTRDLAPSDYTLKVGLYLLETEERLVVLDQEVLADHITIGPFPVESSQ